MTQQRIGWIMAVCFLATAAVAVAADPCVLPINPDGSVSLPPEGCEYQSPDDIHALLKGLPSGTVIHVGASHGAFLCDKREQGCTLGGGALGGQIETASSTVELTITDPSDNWSRTIPVAVEFEVHTAQTYPKQKEFDTVMYQLSGSVAPGSDADFALIEIVSGAQNGFEGRGYTMIGNLGNNTAQVESYFHLSGTIHIVGTPTSEKFKNVDAVFEFETRMEAQGDCP